MKIPIFSDKSWTSSSFEMMSKDHDYSPQSLL